MNMFWLRSSDYIHAQIPIYLYLILGQNTFTSLTPLKIPASCFVFIPYSDPYHLPVMWMSRFLTALLCYSLLCLEIRGGTFLAFFGFVPLKSQLELAVTKHIKRVSWWQIALLEPWQQGWEWEQCRALLLTANWHYSSLRVEIRSPEPIC